MAIIGKTRSLKEVHYSVGENYLIDFETKYRNVFEPEDWFDAMAMFEAAYTKLEGTDAVDLRNIYGDLSVRCRLHLEDRNQLFDCMRSANCAQIFDILNYGKCLISETRIAYIRPGSQSPKAKK